MTARAFREAQMDMNLGISERATALLDRVKTMIADEIMPLEAEYQAEILKGDRWQFTDRQAEILDGLKAKAKAAGLWNFWLTEGEGGSDLSTVEYAYFAEEMGKTPMAAEVFNCNAPDTGNMEVFHKYGTPKMQEDWLAPLMAGDIRSAYLMTEPEVASSDATNISMSCVRDGDHYVLNGEKYWATGAGDPRCKVYIVMVRTGEGDAPKHQRHSMIVVPSDTSGIEKLRPMEVYGHDDAPHGHMHIRFTNVRVPTENILLGEGRGFEIAQGRLGPGRIHHCMRAIGQAEAALDLLCKRALRREAFGKPIAHLGANYDIIAECRMEIEQARLLCLKAAWMMDQGDARAAAPWISQIKVIAPRMALKVIDEAAQIYGATGLSQDTPLATAWTHIRTLRLADGPDAVHRRQVARAELKKHSQKVR
jgi:acyl-CoA dehydrogenase